MLTKEQEIDAAWSLHEKPHRSIANVVYRRELAIAQNWICHYCERTMTDCEGLVRIDTDVTLDHKTPVSRGGTDDLNNLVASCARCNNEKSDMTYDAYMRWIGK